VSGRKSGEAHAAEFNGLAIGELVNRSLAKAKLIQLSRRGRTERELVRRHMIVVCVGDKSTRLATTHVDRQIGASKL
jgi:hypothetical protein